MHKILNPETKKGTQAFPAPKFAFLFLLFLTLVKCDERSARGGKKPSVGFIFFAATAISASIAARSES